MDTFHQVKDTLVGTAKDAGETLVDAAKNARDAVVDAKDAVRDAVIDAKDAVRDAVIDAKDTVRDAVVDAKDAVVEAAQNAKERTFDFAQEASDKVDKLADTVTCALIKSDEDIVAILKADHERIAGYFDQLEATSSAAHTLREGLFGQLKYELETHSAAEEKLFYPTLRKRQGSGALLTEAHTDHDLIKQLLNDLSTQPMYSADWLAQLRVLKENVERHVQMEEDELFAWAEQVMTGAQRDELGLRFQEEKQRMDGDRGRRSTRKTATKKASRGHHHAAL